MLLTSDQIQEITQKIRIRYPLASELTDEQCIQAYREAEDVLIRKPDAYEARMYAARKRIEGNGMRTASGQAFWVVVADIVAYRTSGGNILNG